MHPREVLQANLRLIEGIAERVCRRSRIYGADTEDFVSTVKLRLIEDDYAVLRAWEARASLATYLTIVIARWFADETIRDRGRWHPSTEARRIGSAAMLLESLVRRDGRSLYEALPLVRAVDASLTLRDLEALLARLPERRPRASVVELDPEGADLQGAPSAETALLAKEAHRMTADATRAIRAAVSAFSVEDRMIVRLRFGQSISIADISRMLRLPQRPLYRRIELLLRKLREAVAEAGVDTAATADLMEAAASIDLDLGLRDMELEHGRTSPWRETS